MSFYCIHGDEEIRDAVIYMFENEKEAREFFDCVEGRRLVGFEPIDIDEWITSYKKPDPEELLEWIAPLTLDQVQVRPPISHHSWVISPWVEIFYPVHEEEEE